MRNQPMEKQLQRWMEEILHWVDLPEEDEQGSLQPEGHGRVYEVQEQHLSQHFPRWGLMWMIDK